jgi:hypothetical protein
MAKQNHMDLQQQGDAVRRFNRFYTRAIGTLHAQRNARSLRVPPVTEKSILWTNSALDAARHLYQEEGYKLIKQEAQQSFGKSLVGETWQLAL